KSEAFRPHCSHRLMAGSRQSNITPERTARRAVATRHQYFTLNCSLRRRTPELRKHAPRDHQPHQGPQPQPHHHGKPKSPIKTTLLKRLKWLNRLNRLNRLKWLKWLTLLKRLNRPNRLTPLKFRPPNDRKPEGEFIIGPPCIGIRPIEWGMKPPRIGIPPIECGMKPPCIPIPPIEPPCPLICAVAFEAAKRQAAAQPRRMIFFEFITY